jgi:transcriptional regulator with XRE-family HTH domain
MADLTNTQKKEWARTLYLRENLTQQEIADRVGVSRVTVSNWCRGGKWEQQKVGLTLTRREQVQSLYRQVAEVNSAIQLKPEGQRYPDAKQADTIVKLTSAIRNMEQEVGIADRIAVLTDVIEWMRPSDLDKAKELTSLFDAYIKDKL